MASSNFINISPGVEVMVGQRRYRITRSLDINSVLAEDVETEKVARLRIETMSRVLEAQEGDGTPNFSVHHFSDDLWAVAQRRFEAIKPLLDNPRRSRSSVSAAALTAGVNTSTLYKWLALYHDHQHVAALVPTKRGRNRGTRFLQADQELVIASVIEDFYLQKQKPSSKSVVDEVMRRCRVAKIDAPHPNTVRNRLADIRPATVLRRRGQKDKARDKYEPIRGAFPGADFPLAVVQIDHTPLDVMIVDEEHRKPIGRPYLTLAIDVFSRAVVGLYLTLDAPSATSVAMCISHAMNTKNDYLRMLGVEGDWPVWGQIGTLHADNAKEFKCKAVNRGCQANEIIMQWRPVKKPNYGGHIERYMGVVATEMKKVPGATFSNIHEKGNYDSEKEASLTLKEVEHYLVNFIVNNYHQRGHSQLDAAPIKVWEDAILGGEKPGVGRMLPADPDRVRMDFLPYFKATVQRYGVRIENVFYYDPILDRHIGATDDDNPKLKRKFIIARDPRNISEVYFLDPNTERYIAIPYRNVGHPAISAGELREAKKRIKAEGKDAVDEERIFQSIESNRKLIEESKAKSKAARRQAAKTPKGKPKASVPQSADTSPTMPPQQQSVPRVPDRSIFSQPLEVLEIGEIH
ncbi:DDE-type integrase/transposase/recombinase [Stenotrophomonas maltophilia]|uniref:Mu transposase C-terminal domain-containing protein n=1 Tax=Stenotrophomonas maltophilia group TaxID=995085 RepID=UPI001F15DE28|nr:MULTISPECIES: Mu transposase C-terminal domain-containing protein [Stenotrophomonas]MCF3463437.1 DDE-type integrase/transposase/recombinase [Stenotrophomonas maltophilia]MCF3507954.1 DDE-type integrase/transposase/recombinase [Stenotrophomonas maltophilia]MCU1082898.1 transposase [Stenotrophomonas maltophilia]MCU1155831.1 transposase [Stenotrophomonas maltophilia]MCU1167022.1 transposase [Stenotrophomonas maltophilia]